MQSYKDKLRKYYKVNGDTFQEILKAALQAKIPKPVSSPQSVLDRKLDQIPLMHEAIFQKVRTDITPASYNKWIAEWREREGDQIVDHYLRALKSDDTSINVTDSFLQHTIDAHREMLHSNYRDMAVLRKVQYYLTLQEIRDYELEYIKATLDTMVKSSQKSQHKPHIGVAPLITTKERFQVWKQHMSTFLPEKLNDKYWQDFEIACDTGKVERYNSKIEKDTYGTILIPRKVLNVIIALHKGTLTMTKLFEDFSRGYILPFCTRYIREKLTTISDFETYKQTWLKDDHRELTPLLLLQAELFSPSIYLCLHSMSMSDFIGAYSSMDKQTYPWLYSLWATQLTKLNDKLYTAEHLTAFLQGRLTVSDCESTYRITCDIAKPKPKAKAKPVEEAKPKAKAKPKAEANPETVATKPKAKPKVKPDIVNPPAVVKPDLSLEQCRPFEQQFNDMMQSKTSTSSDVLSVLIELFKYKCVKSQKELSYLSPFRRRFYPDMPKNMWKLFKLTFIHTERINDAKYMRDTEHLHNSNDVVYQRLYYFPRYKYSLFANEPISLPNNQAFIGDYELKHLSDFVKSIGIDKIPNDDLLLLHPYIANLCVLGINPTRINLLMKLSATTQAWYDKLVRDRTTAYKEYKSQTNARRNKEKVAKDAEEAWFLDEDESVKENRSEQAAKEAKEAKKAKKTNQAKKAEEAKEAEKAEKAEKAKKAKKAEKEAAKEAEEAEEKAEEEAEEDNRPIFNPLREFRETTLAVKPINPEYFEYTTRPPPKAKRPHTPNTPEQGKARTPPPPVALANNKDRPAHQKPDEKQKEQKEQKEQQEQRDQKKPTKPKQQKKQPEQQELEKKPTKAKKPKKPTKPTKPKKKDQPEQPDQPDNQVNQVKKGKAKKDKNPSDGKELHPLLATAYNRKKKRVGELAAAKIPKQSKAPSAPSAPSASSAPSSAVEQMSEEQKQLKQDLKKQRKEEKVRVKLEKQQRQVENNIVKEEVDTMEEVSTRKRFIVFHDLMNQRPLPREARLHHSMTKSEFMREIDELNTIIARMQPTNTNELQKRFEMIKRAKVDQPRKQSKADQPKKHVKADQPKKQSKEDQPKK